MQTFTEDPYAVHCVLIPKVELCVADRTANWFGN